jgi:hypothetical protein
MIYLGQIASNIRQRPEGFSPAMWNQLHLSFAGRRCMVLACKEITTIQRPYRQEDPFRFEPAGGASSLTGTIVFLNARQFSRFHRLTRAAGNQRK